MSRTDNTPYSGMYNRMVIITENHEGSGTDVEKKVVIPEDNVVRHTVKPLRRDTKISVRVSTSE